MALEFYYLSGSPFSWKVWLALEHKQIPYDLRVLSADAGDLKQPAFLAISPHGKVPAIADGGFTLYESSAIVEYLEDAYAGHGHPLWPRDVRARAAARRIAAEAVDDDWRPEEAGEGGGERGVEQFGRGCEQGKFLSANGRPRRRRRAGERPRKGE